MKALSLQQPWAWLMVNGWKTIENRKWNTSFRGPVLIHASKSWDREAFPSLVERGNRDAFDCRVNQILDELNRIPNMPARVTEYEMGGIVGMFTITDVVTASTNVWFFGPYGFKVKDARPLPFTPLKGALGFFEVPDEIVRELGLASEGIGR